ncbi:MAG: MarR family transcriptional regulator [Pseudomonadales bacterium]|nr:MarR family transcriptional regulator [Pseudomonadales bacterium]
MTVARESFFAALFNTRNRMRFAMDDAFRPLGITDATWRTLFYLEQTGSGVAQRDLADVMGIEGPSLVRLLDNLERKALIVRRPSETDRRSKTVHLTRDAEKLLGTLHEVAGAVRNRILDEIDESEIELCLDVFARMMAAADRMSDNE